VVELREKVVLVTGGTGGIGKETARGLVRLGARVVVTGRDPGRAAAVAEELGVDALIADVTRQRDLRALAETVGERYGGLYALINNAGVHPPRRELTEDGVESAFAGNVLAPYLLTRLLLPALRRGAAGGTARVVNITGGVPRGRLDPGNLQAERRFTGWLTDTQYNRTKLAMMAVSRTQAERYGGPDIAVTVAYPGHADTPMTRALPIRTYPVLLRPVVPLVRPLMPLLWSDASRPARTAVRVVAADAANGVYVGMNGRRARWPAATTDPAVRDLLWTMCERLAPA